MRHEEAINLRFSDPIRFLESFHNFLDQTLSDYLIRASALGLHIGQKREKCTKFRRFSPFNCLAGDLMIPEVRPSR